MNASNEWRWFTIFGFFALVALLILGQIVRIQNMPQAQWFRDQRQLYEGTYRVLTPMRGEIYDRNGHLLAGNKVVYEISVNRQSMRNPQTIAQDLSVALGMDYAELYEILTDPNDTSEDIYIAGHVPAEIVEALVIRRKALAEQSWNEKDGARPSLSGVIFQARFDRSYPENSLAANVLGYYNWGWTGNFGVEEKYDELLAGSPVTVWVPADPNQVEDVPTVPNGASLVLTIDRELQSALEQLLDEALDDTGARSGTIVVMDPRTGAVYAMVATKRMNLNEFWDYGNVYDNVSEFNPAISQPYEPGSVTKILTMAAALDLGTVQRDTTYFDNGVFFYADTYIRNWDRGAWGQQDMTGCLQHSLNVCLAWISTSMKEGPFYDYMRRFGLGDQTGIDLAGEASGRLKLPGDNDWWPIELATNSYGQGMDVTAIQMMAAASAIANDGQMVTPHVLQAILRDGQSFPVNPRVTGNPIRPETAHTLSDMLAVSLESEASAALVPGYRIAGKTGTAQIPTPDGYDPEATNASFIGWGPVDDPKFMIYVWLERPQTSTWGSQVAAPLFAQAVEKTVILLDIPPDSVRLQLVGR